MQLLAPLYRRSSRARWRCREAYAFVNGESMRGVQLAGFLRLADINSLSWFFLNGAKRFEQQIKLDTTPDTALNAIIAPASIRVKQTPLRPAGIRHCCKRRPRKNSAEILPPGNAGKYPTRGTSCGMPPAPSGLYPRCAWPHRVPKVAIASDICCRRERGAIVDTTLAITPPTWPLSPQCLHMPGLWSRQHLRSI